MEEKKEYRIAKYFDEVFDFYVTGRLNQEEADIELEKQEARIRSSLYSSVKIVRIPEPLLDVGASSNERKKIMYLEELRKLEILLKQVQDKKKELKTIIKRL